MSDPKTNQEIRDWLQGQLDRAPKGKNQAALAAKLGRHRSVINEILTKGRKVSAEELAVMKEFFGYPSEAMALVEEREVKWGVQLVGRIGDNLWTKPSVAPAVQKYVGTIMSDYPPTSQRAYEMVDGTADGQFVRGDIVYAVPFGDYRARPLPGDVVVTRTTEDGFERFGLRIAKQSDTDVVLCKMTSGDDVRPAEKTETPVGLVIGFYRPFRSR